MREANPRVPCGAFYNCSAWFDKALLLSVLNDVQCCPIYDFYILDVISGLEKMFAMGGAPLIEPPGFMNSAFPYISQPVSSLSLLSRIKGVFPIAVELVSNPKLCLCQ